MAAAEVPRPPGGRLAGVRQRAAARPAKAVGIALALALAIAYPLSLPGIGPGFGLLDTSGGTLSIAYVAEVYILLALGLNIVIGFAGLLDLGYAAFFAIGAYTAGALASPHFAITGTSFSSPLLSFGSDGIHVNFFLLIPIAAVIAAIFGLTFGAPTLRLRGDYLAIVTLGFGEIVPILVQNLGSDNGIFLGPHHSIGIPNVTNGVNSVTGLDAPPNINIGGIHWTFQGLDLRPWYYLGLAIIVFSVVIIIRMRDSRLGRSWVAIREDEVAAAHAGVNITGTRLTAFALGAAFSGFGGLLFGSQLGTVSSEDFSFSVSVTILVMVILGGIGSIPGVMIGGALIAFLTERWLGDISSWTNNLGGCLDKGTNTCSRLGFGSGGWLGHKPYPLGGELDIGRAHIVSLGRWLHTLPLDSASALILGIILLVMMLSRPGGIWPSTRRVRELKPATTAELASEQEELYTDRTGQI